MAISFSVASKNLEASNNTSAVCLTIGSEGSTSLPDSATTNPYAELALSSAKAAAVPFARALCSELLHADKETKSATMSIFLISPSLSLSRPHHAAHDLQFVQPVAAERLTSIFFVIRLDGDRAVQVVLLPLEQQVCTDADDIYGRSVEPDLPQVNQGQITDEVSGRH